MARKATTTAMIMILLCMGASTLMAGERMPPEDAQIMRYKSFRIAYAIRDDFGLGTSIQKVELFGTTDLGKTWKNYGTDPDRESPFEISVPDDGVYGFSIVSTDRAGNRELPPEPGSYPERVIIVDSTPPQGAFISPVQNDRIGERGITIAWETQDKYPIKDRVELHVSGDSGKRWFLLKDKLPGSGKLVWNPLGSRAPTYSFRIKVRDRAGNVSLIKAPGVVLSDATAPTARLTGPRTATANNVELTYTAADEPGGSGLDWVELWTTTDGGDNWSKQGLYKDTVSPIAFATETYTRVGFYLRAADRAGNTMPIPTRGTQPGLTLAFDNEGPKVYLTDIKGGNRFLRGGETIEIQWQAEDANLAADSVALSWSADGGQSWTELASKQPAAGIYKWKIPANNERNLNNCLLRVSAVDSLGNEGVVESEQFFSILSRPQHVRITDVEPIEPDKTATIEIIKSEEIPVMPIPVEKPQPVTTHPSDIHIEGSRLPEEDPEVITPLSITPSTNAATLLEQAREEEEARMEAEIAKLLLQEEERKEADLAEEKARKQAELIAQVRREQERRKKIEALKQAELEKEQRERDARDKRIEAIRNKESDLVNEREEDRLAMVDTSVVGVPQVKPTPSPVITNANAIALIRSGNEAFGDGELSQADLYYKQALDVDSNSVEAYVGLAQISRSRNDNKMALNYAEKAYSINPNSVPALLETGQISLSESKKTYKKLRKGMQLNATAGELASYREDLTLYLRNAKRAFLSINKLEKDHKVAYDLLGETYRIQSMIAGDEGERAIILFDAMEAFKAGYEIDEPNYREAFRLGEIYQQRGELDIALRYFKIGVSVCPANRKPRECQWYMAEIYEDQNALDDARFYWGKVMEAYDPTIPGEAGFYNKARERVNEINLKLKY